MFLNFEGGGGFPVKTDTDSWKQTAGPIVEDDIYVGEIYNSTMATPRWDMPVRGFVYKLHSAIFHLLETIHCCMPYQSNEKMHTA